MLGGELQWEICCKNSVFPPSSPDKIPYLQCAKTRATGSSFWHMGNHMIRVRSQTAGAFCSFYTVEANRIWSAVCSLRSTAGRRPGEKMTPGGAVAGSRSRITGRSVLGQRGRNLRSTPLVASGAQTQAPVRVRSTFA
jgi:hypothetical protein